MADVRHITLDGVQLDIPIPGVMTGAGASAAGSAGLVPAPASGQQERFLKGDGTWAEVVTEIDPMTGATSSTPGEEGLVPAPDAGDQNKVLKGDGTWGDPSVMTGATAIANGAKGLAPAPAAGDQNKVLKGDGTWGDPSVMTGATAITNGEKGLVPAPAAGETNRFLRADGSWTVPAGSGDSQVGIYTVDATIPTSAWTANNGVYTVTISDQTVTSTMTVLEWGITNEDDDVPVMLGETDVTAGTGVITITTDAMPSASWTMHIDLGTDGANVLAEVAGKADQELLGYKEDGNTASRAIADGMFVVWKGSLYKANGAIAQGATFSSSNLTAVTNGGLNEIKSDVSTLSGDLDTLEGSVSTLSDDLDTLEGNVGTLSSNVSAFSGKAIANNLTTTSEGYVLDARQGKALNDSVASLNDRITPNVYIGTGQVLQDNVSGSFSAYGSVSVACANGLATIKFTGKVETSSTSQSGQVVITPAMIKALCPSCPNLTVKAGGLADMYTSAGAYDDSKIGYAGRMMTGSGNWQVARVYNTSGSVGAWAPAAFPVGYHISGECYATY